MKKLAAVFFLVGFHVNADSFPYDPVCRRYNGTSETVQVEGVSQKVVLCKFGLNSYIDRTSVHQSNLTFFTQAVFQYQNNDAFLGPAHCTEFGARLKIAKTSTGRILQVCSFTDASFMEEETFSRGPENFTNRELNEALGLSCFNMKHH